MLHKERQGIAFRIDWILFILSVPLHHRFVQGSLNNSDLVLSDLKYDLDDVPGFFKGQPEG
jgi:hypothetical protein